MNEDFYLMDEDSDEIDESSYFEPLGDDDEDSDESQDLSESDDVAAKTDGSIYKNSKLSPEEVKLIAAYDVIASTKEGEEGALEAVVTTVLEHNPSHSSSTTVNYVLRELFHTQGHSRRQNSVYDSGIMTADDISDEDDDLEFNEQWAKERKELINMFIGYLANRDLSQDSVSSVNRKKRHIPAFIIYMFSSGLYGFIMHCPNMPPVYQKEIDFAFKKIQESKEKLVTDLSIRYDEAGRHEIAKTVRDLGTKFFQYEPKVLQTAAQFRELKITEDDLSIYREFRPKWVNMTGTITQEVISQYIKVCENPKKGQFYQLKDKTRAQAIDDVKQLFQDWARSLEDDHKLEIAKKLIFKEN